jgi:hypothetical protein
MAHDAVQALIVAESGMNAYSVLPLASTRIVPSDELAVFTVAAAVAGWAAGFDEDFAETLPEPPPHAASRPTRLKSPPATNPFLTVFLPWSWC